MVPTRTRRVVDADFRTQTRCVADADYLPTSNHRFIPQFVRIAAPLTNLTRKNTPFTWSLREGEAFNELKEVLQHAPILQLADLTREYVVTTDASDFVIGAVLSQVWDDGEHPVAYESRKMNAAEENYPTHERELLAIIHASRT